LILEFLLEPHAKKARLGKRKNKTPKKKANERIARELSLLYTSTTLAIPIRPQITATVIRTRPSVRLSREIAGGVAICAETIVGACGAMIGAATVAADGLAAGPTAPVLEGGFSRRSPHHGQESYWSR
jgi:hypothetical protein